MSAIGVDTLCQSLYIFCFVEVKGREDEVRPNQRTMLNILAETGIKTLIISPNEDIKVKWDKAKKNHRRYKDGEGLESFLSEIEKTIYERQNNLDTHLNIGVM